MNYSKRRDGASHRADNSKDQRQQGLVRRGRCWMKTNCRSYSDVLEIRLPRNHISRLRETQIRDESVFIAVLRDICPFPVPRNPPSANDLDNGGTKSPNR
jgi:hypothetical protein